MGTQDPLIRVPIFLPGRSWPQLGWSMLTNRRPTWAFPQDSTGSYNMYYVTYE